MRRRYCCSFFPVVLISYVWATLRWRKPVLLAKSSLFCLSGAGWYVLLLFGLIAFTVLIEPHTIQHRPLLWIAVTVNLTPLLSYKYARFLGQFIRGIASASTYHPQSILLPLGISFYTFHAISYLVDVAHRRVEPDRQGWSYALYILLFPHLIAGPIVRFKEIRAQFADSYRTLNPAHVSSGLQTFCIVFSKKILIGDRRSMCADC